MDTRTVGGLMNLDPNVNNQVFDVHYVYGQRYHLIPLFKPENKWYFDYKTGQKVYEVKWNEQYHNLRKNAAGLPACNNWSDIRVFKTVPNIYREHQTCNYCSAALYRLGIRPVLLTYIEFLQKDPEAIAFDLEKIKYVYARKEYYESQGLWYPQFID